MRSNAKTFVDNFVVGSLVVDATLYLSVGCSDEFGAEYVFLPKVANYVQDIFSGNAMQRSGNSHCLSSARRRLARN